ncbi:MAG: glycosyltransferase family 2 protein [Wenzhouxiangella sp.]|nr:MAG: glycosyltransferase family 2 protein [Wenzhouxiangella sp.]
MNGALIIAYHPEAGQIERLTARITPQVDRLLIVDNSQPPAGISPGNSARASVIEPGANLGVAEAINRGVSELAEQGCQRVLLLDQDSVPTSTLVATLAEGLDQASKQGRKVAAIGPVIRDQDSAEDAPFVRFALPFNKHLRGQDGVVSCDFLITSGTLINLDCWDEVGPMRDNWFIDSIDLEWCFRARRAGFEILGCFDTRLEHAIGQLQYLIPGQRLAYRHHGPERLYTMMRNRLFLYRSQAPAAWIVQDLLRAAAKFAWFSLLVPPRWKNTRAMLRGLREGLFTRPVP